MNYQDIFESLDKEGDLSKLLHDIPIEMNEVLLLEEESLEDFAKNIRDQKDKIDKTTNQLIISFTLVCYQAKTRAFESLDKQLQTFRSNHDYLRRKLVTLYPKSLSGGKALDKDALTKEIQKTNDYVQIESLIQQIQNDLDEIKILKSNDQATNFESLRQLALTVKRQCEQLPNCGSDTLNKGDSLSNSLQKCTMPLFDELFKIKNENKPISLQMLSVPDFDTKIKLDVPSINFLKSLVAISKPSAKFQLLYRGSRDGFTAEAFHRLCDNKGPTIVLLESNYDKVFGGYASKSWNSKDSYISTQDSFLFSISNQAYYPLKPNQDEHSLFSSASLGPTFGGGYDILIPDFCDTNYCTVNLGFSYDNHGHTESSITGCTSFTIKEIEVFKVESEQSTQEQISEPDSFFSDLITTDEYKMIMNWIGDANFSQLKLVYKATAMKDGFDAQNFHHECDGKKETVVIIRSTGSSNRVFGGYTSQAWDSSNSFGYDSKAFLFSINDMKKFPVKEPEQAIFKSEDAGPVFGGGYDLFICSNSHTDKKSHSHFGHSYDADTVSKSEQYLAGAQDFLVDEIEVFVVESK